MQGFPTVVALDNADFRDRLTSDFTETHGCPQIGFNYFLVDLQIRLQEENKTLEDYGFQLPLNMATILQRETIRINMDEARRELDQLQAREPSTAQQQEFIDYVQEKLRSQTPESPPVCILVQGSGGTGKTTTMKKVLAYARSLGKLSANCASTAMVAARMGPPLVCALYTPQIRLAPELST